MGQMRVRFPNPVYYCWKQVIGDLNCNYEAIPGVMSDDIESWFWPLTDRSWI